VALRVSAQINQFCLPVMRGRRRLNLVTAIDRARRQVLGQALDPPDFQNSLFSAARQPSASMPASGSSPTACANTGARRTVSTPGPQPTSGGRPSHPDLSAASERLRAPVRGRAAVAIVGSRAAVDGRVIRHRTSLPRSTATARPLRPGSRRCDSPAIRFCAPELNNYGAGPLQIGRLQARLACRSSDS
jgi:hypothetical protein